MKNKILITGGSGFLGESLISRLISKGESDIRIFSRNEGALIKTKQKFPNVEIFTGNLSSEFEVWQACKGINQIYHLAAFKHVGLAEKFSLECVNSNLIGTINLLNATRNSDLNFMIAISTDKAAQVNGVYGASKYLMEKIIQEYAKTKCETKFRIVRYGNVLYSTGSVLCKWKDLIEHNKQCILTDINATRFYWTREQAVDLIFECLEHAKDETPYCPTMKSMKVGDLFAAMVRKYGKNYDIPPKIIGLQPGENLHEKILDSGPYSNEVEQYTMEEICKLI